jgi:predicted phage terminase large subunit-like protein
MTKWIRHNPFPKQIAFLALTDVAEVLYGGAAGGGKSDALLMGALQYVDVHGYHAMLFRRTYPQLAQQGGLIERSQEWLSGTEAVYNRQEARWTWPWGASLQFAHLQYEADKYQHQGAELQYVGFDELTHFTESMYLYLLSRLRRPVDGPLSTVPLRARAATNPGGIGHTWVKDRFVLHRNDQERWFVPASWRDNPALDPSYGEQLDLLDPVERARLKEGDWDATGGGKVFQSSWFQVVDGAPAGCRRVRAWDMASTLDAGCATAGARWARAPDGVMYVEDLIAVHLDPGARNELILATAVADGREVEVDWEEEGGSSGKDQSLMLRNLLQGWRTWGTRATGDKVTRAGTWATPARMGRVRLVRGPWNRHFLDAVQRFPEAFKDEVDACSVAFQRLAAPVGPFVVSL